MAGRIHAQDWSTTPLGAVEDWPPSLRTIVDLLLASGLPTIALWGPDLIRIYNDGDHASWASSTWTASSKRRVSATIIALLVACVISVTLNLQRSDRGTVEIPVMPLLDARQALAPPP